MPTARTSESHPLRITAMNLGEGRGRIGFSQCPGRIDHCAISGPWRRDLDTDLDAIQHWGATAVLSLVSHEELAYLKVSDLPNAVRDRHMEWWYAPIPDGEAPERDFEDAFLKRTSSLRTSCSTVPESATVKWCLFRGSLRRVLEGRDARSFVARGRAGQFPAGSAESQGATVQPHSSFVALAAATGFACSRNSASSSSPGNGRIGPFWFPANRRRRDSRPTASGSRGNGGSYHPGPVVRSRNLDTDAQCARNRASSNSRRKYLGRAHFPDVPGVPPCISDRRHRLHDPP